MKKQTFSDPVIRLIAERLKHGVNEAFKQKALKDKGYFLEQEKRRDKVASLKKALREGRRTATSVPVREDVIPEINSKWELVTAEGQAGETLLQTAARKGLLGELLAKAQEKNIKIEFKYIVLRGLDASALEQFAANAPRKFNEVKWEKYISNREFVKYEKELRRFYEKFGVSKGKENLIQNLNKALEIKALKKEGINL